MDEGMIGLQKRGAAEEDNAILSRQPDKTLRADMARKGHAWRIARTQVPLILSPPPEHPPQAMPTQPSAASIGRLARARRAPWLHWPRMRQASQADQALAAVSRVRRRVGPVHVHAFGLEQGDGQRRQAEKHAAAGQWNQALRQVMQALAAPTAASATAAARHSNRPPPMASAVSAT